MKSKGRKRRKNVNFFTLLICNYIALTLILVVVLSTLFVVGMIITSEKVMEAGPEQILNYKIAISKGRYTELPLDQMLGEGGYIVVLDEDLKVVYESNDKAIVPNFSAEEIKYIPYYNTSFNVYTDEFVNENNERCTSVWVNYLEEDGDDIKKLYVVDEELNILYQSDNDGKKALTEREYALLTNTLYKEYSLTKYIFEDELGSLNTMLIYQPWETQDILFSKVSLITKSVFSSFFVIYFALIGGFIIWLNRKVKKPLNLLHNAMEKFSKGQRQVYVDYNGPREFEEICQSFNNMAMELSESEKNRKKLEQDKQKMLADISHDLKTPITVIQGYAKLINDGIVSEDEKPQYLETIYKKAEGLTGLIDTFYEYSKINHPDYSLVLQQCDICIFLRDYIADKYNELELSGFDLEVDIPEERIICNIDKVQLKRVFENIITNTLKHNGKGTTITCVLSQEEEAVSIILADDGCGISEEIRDYIFEPFVVGEKSRSKEGSGLGLAISKRIIQAHGGSISLIFPPDNDYKTEFKIILPKLK